MTMVIKVEEVKSQDLKPGDLFSTAKMEHWDSVNKRTGDILPLGEKVYIRTNAPTPETEHDYPMVRLTIEIVEDPQPDNPEEAPEVRCPNCEGQARIDDETCSSCDGTGTLAKEDFDASGH